MRKLDPRSDESGGSAGFFGPKALSCKTLAFLVLCCFNKLIPVGSRCSYIRLNCLVWWPASGLGVVVSSGPASTSIPYATMTAVHLQLLCLGPLTVIARGYHDLSDGRAHLQRYGRCMICVCSGLVTAHLWSMMGSHASMYTLIICAMCLWLRALRTCLSLMHSHDK